MSGALPTSPTFNTINLKSLHQTLYTESQSKKGQSRSYGGHQWKFTAQYPRMTRAQFMPIYAFILKQKGRYDTFTVAPPDLADPQGSWGRNKLTYSEQFDSGAWGKTNANGTVTANAISGPNGESPGTADSYIEDSSTTGRVIYQLASFTSGTTYTLSCYAKIASGTRYLGLLLGSNAFGANVNASFTLSGGGAATIGTSGTNTSVGIESLGSGWYRCWLMSDATADASAQLHIRISNSSSYGAPTYTGDGSSGLYLWGAQLNEDSLADYVKTEASNGASPLVAGGSQTGTTLNIDATSCSTTGYGKAGDLFTVAGDTKVYILTADVDSDASSTATLTFEPALVTSPANNAAITWQDVAFTMRLANDLQQYNVGLGPFYNFELDLIEAL